MILHSLIAHETSEDANESFDNNNNNTGGYEDGRFVFTVFTALVGNKADTLL